MLRSEQGQALLVALMVVVLLTALGTAGLTIAAYSRQASAGELDRTQALYVADAGLELALGRLKVDPLWRDGFTGLPFGGGTIEKVTVTELSRSESSVRVKVYSAGSYPAGIPRARKRVVAEVTISYDPFICCKGVADKGGVHIAGERPGDELAISSTTAVIGDNTQPTNLIFGGAGGSMPSLLTLTVNKSMMGPSGPVVKGNVYTRGNVSVTAESGCSSGSVVVDGGIWAGGTITVGSNDLVTGGTHYLDPGRLPYFPAEISATGTAKAYYRAIAESYGADHYFSSDHCFSSSELQNMNGVYFVNGKAIIDGYYSNYTGRATVVAATYIEFNGASLSPIDPENNVRGFISLQDTFFSGNNNVQAVILCGDTLCLPDGNLVTIQGAVAAWAAEIGNAGGRRHGPCWYHKVPANTQLTYQPQLFKCYPPGMPYTVTIDSWKEL